MDRLEFTLLADSSSDAILIQPLKWLLQHNFNIPIDGTWADLRRLPNPPKTLRSRIDKALDLYPCDILFVHRDAEGEPHEQRIKEITSAMAGLQVRAVPVVPIRMQETWLLIDEQALRRAAGNPHGRVGLKASIIIPPGARPGSAGVPPARGPEARAPRKLAGVMIKASLKMPAIDDLEDLPNPKQVLHELLIAASELTGRRRQKLNPGRQALRLGELIEDYGPLQRLSAFREVETAMLEALQEALQDRRI